MIRQVAFLMHASKGALTHEGIMRLTWRQFQVYLESFNWLLAEQSEDGRKENKAYDEEYMRGDPRIKARLASEAEKARRYLSGIRKK